MSLTLSPTEKGLHWAQLSPSTSFDLKRGSIVEHWVSPRRMAKQQWFALNGSIAPFLLCGHADWVYCPPPAQLIAAFVDRLPIGRAATPDDIAGVIVFLASDDAVFVNGVILPVDGGLGSSNGQPNFLKLLGYEAWKLGSFEALKAETSAAAQSPENAALRARNPRAVPS
jgi:hypothetical protein